MTEEGRKETRERSEGGAMVGEVFAGFNGVGVLHEEGLGKDQQIVQEHSLNRGVLVEVVSALLQKDKQKE